MRALVTVNLEEDENEVTASLRRAVPLLERLVTDVDLVYVSPPMPYLDVEAKGNRELGPLLDAALDRRDDHCKKRLGTLLEHVPHSLRGDVLVTRSRDVAREIVARTERHDLVVVGTHARRGLPRLWLGSVAELVVRSSHVPILVLGPETPHDGTGGILLAVDVMDNGAESLVAQVAPIAERLALEVDLIYVVPTLIAPNPAWLPFATPGSDGLTVHTEAILGRLTNLAAAFAPALRGEVRVEHGDPMTLISAAARDYELLALGTHGRTGLERVALGSVAERVVRWSPVPVLVVPPAE
jgi:nucleotide-binding universal stress UspA family protein